MRQRFQTAILTLRPWGARMLLLMLASALGLWLGMTPRGVSAGQPASHSASWAASLADDSDRAVSIDAFRFNLMQARPAEQPASAPVQTSRRARPEIPEAVLRISGDHPEPEEVLVAMQIHPLKPDSGMRIELHAERGRGFRIQLPQPELGMPASFRPDRMPPAIPERELRQMQAQWKRAAIQAVAAARAASNGSAWAFDRDGDCGLSSLIGHGAFLEAPEPPAAKSGEKPPHTPGPRFAPCTPKPPSAKM